MTQLPLVSVLVTAHDAADGLATSLEGALAQEYPPELLELIVVHGGDAATDAVAAGYAELFPARVRVVAQPGAGPLAATARSLR